MGNGSVVVVGGTGGIGKQLAGHYAASGEAVVITGRDQERATAIAAELGPNVAGIGFDLGEPGGIASLIRTLAIELAPIRFNAIHPGIVGDSPFWESKPLDAVVARTPTGRLVTMAEVVDATVFLGENGGVNGVNLYVDGGWMLM
jgi:NAD(P)-dependent dehydrogenase (short-subunit alcohol dehydrogenase family)